MDARIRATTPRGRRPVRGGSRFAGAHRSSRGGNRIGRRIDRGPSPASRFRCRRTLGRRQALALGCRTATVLTVDVAEGGSLEAAAREARYNALRGARTDLPVLLGHTLDDQAETVLLGLSRGSGGRSIQGMTAFDAPWGGRPLLGIRRSVTRAACVDLEITPWEDPHNNNPEFTRVRLRHEALPLLEEILGGGEFPKHWPEPRRSCVRTVRRSTSTPRPYSYGLLSTGKWKWTHLPKRPPQSVDALCAPGCCRAAQKH